METANPSGKPIRADGDVGLRAAAAVALVLLYALCRGLFLVATVPPWQGPDEPGHAEYALLLARGHVPSPHGDAALERAILRSMATHGFYPLVGTDPPTTEPNTFTDVPRLGGEPTQLANETPVGYLPYALVAAIAPTADPAGVLGRMRLASVALVLVTLAATALAAREILGPHLALSATALAATVPMLGFAGAVVNNDLPAAALGSIWFLVLGRALRRGFAHRRAAALVLVALLAALAKRSALFLLPLLLLMAVVWLWQRRPTDRLSELRSVLPPVLPWSRLAAVGGAALLGLAVALWPVDDRAAGWRRAGREWGAERTTEAAHSGGWGLHLEDASTTEWQYVEQTVPVSGGDNVRSGIWLKSTVPGTRAQLVVNDDGGVWLGATVTLSPQWQLVEVAGRLSMAATRVRLAIVPGNGTAAGMGVLDADDATLLVDDRARLSNGGAEAPRRAGSVLAAGAVRYTDAGRLIAAVPGGFAEPESMLRRARRGLAFSFSSLWGGFGWLTIWPGSIYYLIAAGIALSATLAAALALLAPDRLALDQAGSAGLRICALAAVLAVATAVGGSMAGAPPDRLPQGRYLLPALVPLTLPAVALAQRLRPKLGPLALAGIALGLDLASVVLYIWPTYSGLP